MIQIIYGLLALIDMLVYSIASSLLGLISDLANTQFFTDVQISDIARRVYIVVGVLMLFKIVVSAVQYIVNPDVFEDKEKGLAGILKKSVISIALIVLVPSIFGFLIEIQTPIIKTLPDVILGSGTSDKTDERTIGFNLSFKVLSAFVRPNPDAKNAPSSAKGIGEGYDIHDFPSFVVHVADGCPGINLFGIAGNMKENCYYDYMIIISTLCGGFLCYVLLSMVLDVSIRTIKFGIIQILAPVPIAGYIFSKDKLNKFVKTATTVYLDLFVRMIIIYFIIFAIRAMLIENNLLNVLNINGGGVADTGDWFRNVVVNIALIFGLLMFAKKAPKFISELLGLPDIGAGDMADMFKPAWQRAGGAAGALINPGRNAVSNYRKAWANNADMGSKLRRAINASRHAAGGLAKGTLDSVQGVMNGDDWAKMNQRHASAVKKSDMRSAASYMKRTDKQAVEGVNEEISKRRKQIEDFYKKQGIDINNIRRNSAATAKSAYDSYMTGLSNDINTLQQKLANGSITATERTTLDDNIREYERLSTSTGRKEWINNKVNEYAKQTADDFYKAEVKSKTTRQGEITNALANARTRYANATTDSEKSRIQSEIYGLVNEQDEINAFLARSAKDVTAEFEEYVKTGTLKEEKPNISTQSILRGRVDKFFGGEGFTGQGFIDTADLLKNNRSSLYTGEAMTKMRQNADILIKEDGTPASFTSSFATDTSREYTYAEIADLKRRADSGVKIDWTTEGFENAAMLQSAFEEVEKKAAEAYVTANMAAADPTVHSEFKLKRGEANTTIVEGIKRMKAQLATSNIPKEERDQLLKELSENPGKFFKTASDKQEKMRTRGSRISAYNSGKKDA